MRKKHTLLWTDFDRWNLRGCLSTFHSAILRISSHQNSFCGEWVISLNWGQHHILLFGLLWTWNCNFNERLRLKHYSRTYLLLLFRMLSPNSDSALHHVFIHWFRKTSFTFSMIHCCQRIWEFETRSHEQKFNAVKWTNPITCRQNLHLELPGTSPCHQIAVDYQCPWEVTLTSWWHHPELA